MSLTSKDGKMIVVVGVWMQSDEADLAEPTALLYLSQGGILVEADARLQSRKQQVDAKL